MPELAEDLVFISYSHKDAAWRDRLLVLLKPFVRQGQLQVWADPYIADGGLWKREIDGALNRARIGVVLLTSDLLASDFVFDVELPLLLRAAKAGLLTLLVVPIQAHATGATRLQDGDLLDFQWPLDPSQPLEELPEDRRTGALVRLTDAIVRAVGSKATNPVKAVPQDRSRPSPSAVGSGLAVLFGVPALPPHYLRWDTSHHNLKAALLGTSPVVALSASGGGVGLHGPGGLGKTVVAQGVVLDDEIRRAFPDGVYWLTLGQQPRVETLQNLLATWCGEQAVIEDISSGTRVLRKALRDKKCLLVLDDVWRHEHASAFDVLDGTSRLLVTTRDSSLLTALNALELHLETWPPDVALELLAQWTGVTPSELPMEATDIVHKVDSLPLALSLAGAQVRDGRSWLDVLEALRAGDLVYLDHPYGSVFKSIRASLDALPPSDVARYLELAVFPEDVAIPVAIIEQLWATGGLASHSARVLLARFLALNLLRSTDRSPTAELATHKAPIAGDDQPTQMITMHDLQHDFVRLVIDDLRTVHGRLVDAFRASAAAGSSASLSASERWATLPPMPRYPWEFLAYHLHEAGYVEELKKLLISTDWLFAKLTRASRLGLVADYDYCAEDDGLVAIRDALRLSSHALDDDPRSLVSQLAGRLLASHDSRIQDLIASLPRPLRGSYSWRPETASLIPPGGPLLKTFGLSSALEAMTALPDGRRILVGGNRLQLVDLVSEGVVLDLDDQHVSSIALLPDGMHALSVSHSTVTLWDLTSGTRLQAFQGHKKKVLALAVLPEQGRAITASADKTLKVWDLKSGVLLRTFTGNSQSFDQIVALPDGQRLLCAGSDGRVRLLDLTTGGILTTFDVRKFLKTGAIHALAVLPDGRHALVAGEIPGGLQLLDLASGEILRTFYDIYSYSPVKMVAVLPDGERVLSVSFDRFTLWEIRSGEVVHCFHSRDFVDAVTILPNGQLAVSSSGNTVSLWSLSPATGADASDHVPHVFLDAMALLPDHQRAVSGGSQGRLSLWDLRSASVLNVFHTDPVFASITGYTKLRPPHLWDFPSTRDLGQRSLPSVVRSVLVFVKRRLASRGTDSTAALGVLPDGQTVLYGDGQGRLMLIDLGSGAIVRILGGHTRGVTAVEVLPAGDRALSASCDGTIKLWDLASGEILRTFRSGFKSRGVAGRTLRPGVNALALLGDGHRVISAHSQGFVAIWDLSSKSPIRWVEGDAEDIMTIAVTTDGKAAFVGTSKGRIKRLHLPLEEGEVHKQVENAHRFGIAALQVLPCGYRVISVGKHDRKLKLWDLHSELLLATYYGDAPFESVVTLSSGTRVVAGDRSGRIHIVRVDGPQSAGLATMSTIH